MLEGDEEAGGGVELHVSFVVGGPEGGEEVGGDGEEGDVFNVWVAVDSWSEMETVMSGGYVLVWMISDD